MHIITTSLLLVIASQILVSAEEWRANKKPQLIPAEMFEIDPSLEVKVWATTPMLYNPTNMDIGEAFGGFAPSMPNCNPGKG